MSDSKQTILVVDDDPNIAQLVRLYLEKEGYAVTVWSAGTRPWPRFRKIPPA